MKEKTPKAEETIMMVPETEKTRNLTEKTSQTSLTDRALRARNILLSPRSNSTEISISFSPRILRLRKNVKLI